MNKPLTPKDVQQKLRLLYKRSEAIQQEITATRKRCAHHGHVSYSQDPSGNNDSSYDCSACGQSWRRWPEGVE